MIKISASECVSLENVDVILVSDFQEIAIKNDRLPPVLRICWNGASEVFENFEKSPTQVRDTHLTFFTDVATQLSSFVSTAYVPFVFSKPGFLVSPTASRIGYVGEVDITSRCFHSFNRSVALQAMESVENLSREITQGHRTLCDVLSNPPDDLQRWEGLILPWKWSLLNWIRWRLISTLVIAFPQRVELRGNDWANLGFRAKKSRYHPLVREFGYVRNAVSVDFGSKSTTDCIYPRSTEIIINKGGILQLNSGSLPPQSMPELAKRRFFSETELLDMTEKILGQSRKMRNETDEALKEEIENQRDIGVGALIAICADLASK
jgi:hypothetical protein